MPEKETGKQLKELEGKLKGTILWNEPMSKHTSYGIGGSARGFFYPVDENDLKSILKAAWQQNIKIYIIGSGSNLLVSDTGFDGIVISLSKHFRSMTVKETHVFAQSGTMMGHFVKECLRENLTGVESLIGVPGTLGGAVRMNAGAYGHEISNFLKSLSVMTLSGEQRDYERHEVEFSYRSSSLSDDQVILAATFEMEKGEPEKIRSLKAKASQSRKATQPLRFRSAGSVFKNPPNAKPAGYLIERAGLKGTKRGAAEISPKHGNFFLNHGGSTAEDIAWLIRLARKTVQKKLGVDLELEIKTLGFSPDYFDA
ncbi:MAG: UDP-N-acetylmuramate dehydrogenase [Candidatus Neomarinimicrobiota bacterium]